MNCDVNLHVFICSYTLCVPAIFEDVGRLRQDYSQTRSSVPVANELMNSLTEE